MIFDMFDRFNDFNGFNRNSPGQRPKGVLGSSSQSLLFFPCISLIIGRRPGGIDSWSLVCDESRIFIFLGGSLFGQGLDQARFWRSSKNRRFFAPFKNFSKSRINRPLGADGAVLHQKVSAAPRRVQAVLN